MFMPVHTLAQRFIWMEKSGRDKLCRRPYEVYLQNRIITIVKINDCGENGKKASPNRQLPTTVNMGDVQLFVRLT